MSEPLLDITLRQGPFRQMDPVGSLVESLFRARCESQGVVVSHVTSVPRCDTLWHTVSLPLGALAWLRSRSPPTTSVGGQSGCNTRDLGSHLVCSNGETSTVSAMTCPFDKGLIDLVPPGVTPGS